MSESREELRQQIAEALTSAAFYTSTIEDPHDAADAVLAVPGVAAALQVLEAMETQAPVVIVPRRFLVEVDSVTSLVAYRYRVPDDIRKDLIDLSGEARRLYEPRSVLSEPT